MEPPSAETLAQLSDNANLMQARLCDRDEGQPSLILLPAGSPGCQGFDLSQVWHVGCRGA